jgi:translation initiation factor 1A
MYQSLIRNAKKRNQRQEKSRAIELPDDDQEFAVVERMLGNGRVEVFCADKKMRVMRIRGSMRKYKSKVIINPADLVVISRWEFEADKGDLIHKYSHEEMTHLMYQRMLPESIYKKLNKLAGGTDNPQDDYFVFADDTVGAAGYLEEESSHPTDKKPNHPDDFNIEDI